MLTPSSRLLAIGDTRPNDPAAPLEFRWRPYFYLDVGHTIKKGMSSETDDTVLRFVPRARAELFLNCISQKLHFHQTLLYADDKFYRLPLENGAQTHNFFVSGLEFDINKNFGFAMTYKVGKEAPKFERVHTFGGAFTIRFGKE
jgi:hypothetical protein